MKDKITVSELISLLESEKIRSWFDLGLFLDRVRDASRENPSVFRGSRSEFEQEIGSRGIAFVTFFYSVDGVSVEINKYARLFNMNFPSAPVYYLGGRFKPEAGKHIPSFVNRVEISGLDGFDRWPLYRDFFFTRLERGSEAYNSLIVDFWGEVLMLAKKLGSFVEDQNIGLFYLVNVCSNPGNISLCLACVLLSEYLGIPVINNNHDFYWEGGNRSADIDRGLKPGPRDFFFTNAHLGEIFSLIEILYPWESGHWINVNINESQTDHLIRINGHNPARVMEIGTAVDTEAYMNIHKWKRINAFLQFERVLSRYQDRLIAYTACDIIDNGLIDPDDPVPVLIGARTRVVDDFISENIIFLQPTRIISRKRIEAGFRLLAKMMEDPDFRERLTSTPGLKFTILVTGPVAEGHHDYLSHLILRFDDLLSAASESYRDRLFLAFLFSELDKESFKDHFEEPVGIPELYSISSLVLLPSKTEGRGLPIIEAAASGIPVFCRRYFPKNVYSRVIGKHLDEHDRFRVIEFNGRTIGKKHVRKILERVFFPHQFADEIKHNRRVVIRRYSLEALNNNILEIMHRLHHQMSRAKDPAGRIRWAFSAYRELHRYDDENLRSILHTENRQYIAGFGKLEFMLRLKSLIDPSFFRIEEQEIRGYLFQFARELILTDPDDDMIPQNKKIDFYNAVEQIFLLREGEDPIRHDHSFAYRHRNRIHYPYREYTLQELTGLVNLLNQEILQPMFFNRVDEEQHFFTDWNLALLQLTGSNHLAIDNRSRLIGRIRENVPIAYFPGEFLIQELDVFALQSVRLRLGLRMEEPLTPGVLAGSREKIAPVYIFTQERSPGRLLNSEETTEYIVSGNNDELRLIHQQGLLQIVPTSQLSAGIHFAQLGPAALRILRMIRDGRGFLITNRRDAAIMTDIVDIDRFHIGKIGSETESNMMGIPRLSGYIQFVPAGVRTILSYPVPVQTACDFDRVMKGKRFRTLATSLGEEKVFDEIREDAGRHGSPLRYVLDAIGNRERGRDDPFLGYEHITGVYPDGLPYNGILARADLHPQKGKWTFRVFTSSGSPKPVTEFVRQFEKETGYVVRLAWNGGYILNPELVGKLGLPEGYIGTPLGLLVCHGEVISPPLFNRPAMLVYDDGHLDIRRVSCLEGFTLVVAGRRYTIPTGR